MACHFKELVSRLSSHEPPFFAVEVKDSSENEDDEGGLILGEQLDEDAVEDDGNDPWGPE